MRNVSTSQRKREARVRASPQFDGRVFVNQQPVSLTVDGVPRPTMQEFLCGGERRVPGGPLPLVDPAPRWRTPAESGLRVTWLGHSTLLLEIGGARILTDPVWAARASPLSFAGPKRFHPPPASLRHLPPLDVVLISHDHYDHLDRTTIRTLARSTVPFVASLGVGAHLERWGVPPGRIHELDWWESITVSGVEITAAPAQHFSGRGLRDRNATLWSSFHLRSDRHSLYHGADSGLAPHYSEIATRFGPFDLVTLEIGAYHPSWGTIHLGPEHALEAWRRLGSGLLMPMHWATFNLAMHPWDEPPEVLARVGGRAGVPLLMPRLGEPVEPARGARVDPWWRDVSSVAVDASAPSQIVARGLARMVD